MSNDFKRPEGIPEGILLNTNNEALQAYKKAKLRMSKVDSLQNQLDQLTQIVQQLQQQVNGRNTNTN